MTRQEFTQRLRRAIAAGSTVAELGGEICEPADDGEFSGLVVMLDSGEQFGIAIQEITR